MINIEYLRSFRLFGFAIFDLSVSFLGVLLLSPILTRLFRLIKLDIPLVSWMFFTLPLGISIHILVGNYTPMTKDFLSLNGGIVIKLVVIGLFILGARSVKVLK